MSAPIDDQSTYDFHLHTECSDGYLAPSELCRRAASNGLTGISITDHDTLDAYGILGETVKDHSPWILTGIEFSTRMGDDELHILGYFPRGVSEPLVEFVEDVLERRRQRAVDGIRSLRDRGVDITLEECARSAGGRVITRTHIANTLLAKGIVTSPQQAYNHLLGRQVFPLPDLSSDVAVKTIRDVGGIAVWAHPFREHVNRCLEPLAQSGLQGMEVHTPWRRSGEVKMLLGYAATHGMFVTAGSDWHGTPSGPPFGTFQAATPQVTTFLEVLCEAGYAGGGSPPRAES